MGGPPLFNHVEVISLYPQSNPVPRCMKGLANLPFKVGGAAAAMVYPGTQIVVLTGVDLLYKALQMLTRLKIEYKPFFQI